MNFLKCTPTVFVIENDYEILINTISCGIISVNVNGKTYYEENSGVLSSEKSFAKIRLPQTELNKAKSYEICFRKRVKRQAYFSKFDEKICATFSFSPIDKTENINVYHVADVHYNFNSAIKTCSYFKNDIDLFIVNGDIGEVETEENYFEVARFTGEISHGQIPVVFARGNHDTRGKLAEKFTDYFPANGKDTFFTFNVGAISGVVLDCGEDKLDSHPEYNNVNDFSSFRQKQLKFLSNLNKSENKYFIAVCHMCPVIGDIERREVFTIETNTYKKWNDELIRIGVDLMICGHYHKTFIAENNDAKNLFSHPYPVIVGSALDDKNKVIGCAMVLQNNTVEISFTDENNSVLERKFLKI